MQVEKKTKKRIISTFALMIMVFGVVSTILIPMSPAYAQVSSETIKAGAQAAAKTTCAVNPKTGIIPTVCPGNEISEALEIVGDKIAAPAFRVALIKGFMSLVEFVLNRVAYEAAVAIASAGSGQESLFYGKSAKDSWGQFGLDIAGEALGQLGDVVSGDLGIGFDLCSPGVGNPLINLQLSLGLKQKYQPQKPKCDILEVASNWDSFISDSFTDYIDPETRNDKIQQAFAESLKPGRNELTAALEINVAIDHKIYNEKLLSFFDQKDKDYKAVTDFITGNQETPSSTVQANFEKQLLEVEEKKRDQIDVGELANAGELIGGLALMAGSTFTNTLLSTVMQRVYDGLFKPDINEIDLWDYESDGSDNREDAENRFASVLATSPIAQTEYNALSEFVVCVASTSQNRALNECVMDTNFYAAIARGNAGEPLTVQEAIDEGLLNGDWPLISPEDMASNMDSSCYTYGYCYGNLVKLRKARVIPIGWELAALRSNPSNPATLQEIIDGFDDCTDLGTVGPANSDDGNSKWCHLIDPNWVLKYPDSQCRAVVNGEIRMSSMGNARMSTCVDAPSCISEDNDGNCEGGYGYCTRERNVWRFRGDECPEEYATCLELKDTTSNDKFGFLLNTTDFSVCGESNAGCLWYRTNKYFYDGGTEDDTSDDTYEWLPEGVTYDTAEREIAWKYQDGSSSSLRASFAEYANYQDYVDGTAAETYSFEDRIYFTHSTQECSSDEVGCSWLFEIDDDTVLNVIQNPSFEDDEDGDSFPDFWIDGSGSGAGLDDSGEAYYGSNVMLGGTGLSASQIVPLAANNFYTLSIMAYADNATYAPADVSVQLFDDLGNAQNLSGTSYSGDCSATQASGLYELTIDPSDTDTFETSDWTSFACTFTTNSETSSAQIIVSSSDAIRLDAIQLELGEDTSSFTDGYNGSDTSVYYQIAPDYLGCNGDETDPEDCGSYATMCSAQEVGCNLYTPDGGGPNVPAIVSDLDECPEECVGYTTYKQEATIYDDEEFPVYFIAEKAGTCSEQYVGCDAFTNLSSVEEGGEEVEHYTELRACLTTDMADNDEADKTASTFFTWEGSDNEGYQLQTWYLLESNITTGTTITYSEAGVDPDEYPEYAPCVDWQVDSEYEVVCVDTVAAKAALEADDDCNEHDDIFDNPDCREFFDEHGNIHYRLYSETISVDDECTPYRKDVSTETDCTGSGGFWTPQGFCRYFGLQDESTSCPSAAAGCREYTGGSGRNASTVLDETFEDGTYEDFVAYQPSGTAELSISNESVATDGHSFRVYASGGEVGFDTVHLYIDSSDPEVVYDSEDEDGTCNDYGWEASDSGCLIETADESCTVSEGDASCGTLVDSLVAGKTFVLDFWAKGDGELEVQFVNEGGDGDFNDMVGGTGTIELGGSWELYSLGPFDSETDDLFDENAILRFIVSSEGELYIDNLTLKQTEENVTVIKDSWIIPSTCDMSPTGTESDQYYLGCEAYTDQNGNDANLYQFSELCSEDVVGCEAFYNTYNSESEYTQIFNARCAYDDDNDLLTENVVTETTTCTLEGEDLCTITIGSSYCTFDADRAYADPLPYEVNSMTGTGFGIVYGPETVVVPGDQPIYIVAESSYECSSQYMGCQEFGTPTFNQDQSEVESFESVYLINLPSEYEDLLCADEALFCEEWSSTQDGNFYFKDPLNKTCDYESSVTIDGQDYYGWFRTDTTTPCYFDDDDGDGEWEVGGEDAYLIAGEELGVWRNGDEDYEGWVSNCPTSHDLCTEFIDVVDTGGGLNEEGYSYYFVNDELLDEETLSDTQRCEGLVSQKFGCALFNNTTNSDLKYNAGASYVASMHADAFFDNDMNSLQDPINCEVSEGGYVELSQSEAADIGVSMDAYGNYVVDLCSRRCSYTLEDDNDEIDTLSADYYGTGAGDNVWYERSCLVEEDCPVLNSILGETVEGTCGDIADDAYYLQNDVNEIIKVNRDRSCASWLACESSRTSWDTVSSTYQTICDSINLCTEGGSLGDTSTCTSWDETEPEVLTDVLYSQRDVNWTGYEFSGFSIPNQLPVEFYDQFNINPTKACVSASLYPDYNEFGNETACDQAEDCPTLTGSYCDEDADCESGACDGDSNKCYYICQEDYETDYRLVYNAGPCDSSEDGGVGEGGDCAVGICEDSGDSCSNDDDCGAGDDCIVGWCQATGSVGFVDDQTGCTEDSDCAGISSDDGYPTEVCDVVQQVCVNWLLENALTSCVSTDDCYYGECVQLSTSAIGACFNDRCLTDIVDNDGDGTAEAIESNTARIEECRGYPEIDSPFPSKVVASGDDGWRGTTSKDGGYEWGEPYTFVSGYQDSKVCSPNSDEEWGNDDCLCSYDKIGYGKGSRYQYYEAGAGAPLAFSGAGVCGYGPYEGTPCDNDEDCTDGDSMAGTCQRQTSLNTVYGWAGYCIEKDSSIQLYASAEEEDQACLTWLPVDQLSGATDLYGKFTEAGYPLTDAYYCTEVAQYYDLYPTGSRLGGDGSVASIEFACADSDQITSRCDWDDEHGEEYGSGDENCVDAAICPDNYVAILGHCDNTLSDSLREQWSAEAGADAGEGQADSLCDDSFIDDYLADHGLTDDCPYTCIHEDSRHQTGEDAGELCVETLDECYPSQGSNIRGQTVYKAGWLADECDAGGVEYDDVEELASDCVTRGVEQWFEGDLPIYSGDSYAGYYVGEDWLFSDREYYSHMGFGPMADYQLGICPGSNKLCTESDNCLTVGFFDYCLDGSADTNGDGIVGGAGDIPMNHCLYATDPENPGEPLYCDGDDFVCQTAVYDNNTCSFETATSNIGSMMPYLACAQVAQVATDDPSANNKAWTNRLWDTSFETTNRDDFDDDGDEFSYEAGEAPVEAGRLLFGEVFSPLDGYDDYYVIGEMENDSFPLPVLACDSDNQYAFDEHGQTYSVGLSTRDECTETKPNWEYPTSAQWLDPEDEESFLPASAGGAAWLGLAYEDVDYGQTTSGYFYDDILGDFGNSSGVDGDAKSISLFLSQFFASVYAIWDYDDGYQTGYIPGGGYYRTYDSYGFDISSGYDELTDTDIDENGMGTANEFPDADERAPVIAAVGQCIGTDCYEEDEDTFTVNNVFGGTIVGEGQKSVNLAFFAYAQSNQLPLRNIIIDWGDDFGSLGSVGDDVWPTGSQSGSDASNNFYKNHRGMNQLGSAICDDSEWGRTSDSCSDSYISFSKNYVCTAGRLSQLEDGRDCVIDDDTGLLVNSPCTGGDVSGGDDACVFQPRIHAVDNWGWCTGYCDAGDDGTEACYGDECNFNACPGMGDCVDYYVSGTSNPWVNFDGYVIVDPE